MNNKTLCIATMTWARDAAEDKLLRNALLELSKLNLPTFITDGGSDADFINYINSFSNFTLLQPRVKGVWPQVQTSLNAAFEKGTPFVVYTEPDKMDFFMKGLPDMLEKITVDDQSGIVLAARSDAGFRSYPTFQHMSETTINNCCAEVTGVPTDYTYGPFIINREIIPYFDGLKDSIGWGWRLYAFVIASRLGYKVAAFEGAYYCQTDQGNDNASERVYRMKQLSESIEGIVLASKALNNK